MSRESQFVPVVSNALMGWVLRASPEAGSKGGALGGGQGQRPSAPQATNSLAWRRREGVQGGREEELIAMHGAFSLPLEPALFGTSPGGLYAPAKPYGFW